jgi:hypothetical protein
MHGKRFVISLLVTLSLAISLLVAAPAQAVGQGAQVFFVPLSGANEVPARETPARGFAVFILGKDQESMRFALFAFKIDNVVFSHIHVTPATAPEPPTTINGPVALFLLHDQPAGGGRHNGLLAHGTLTAADFTATGPLAGQPFSALVTAISEGRAYVNVHTNDGVDPGNTGPGDFPGGELRGQID